jgi:hypothetical protein
MAINANCRTKPMLRSQPEEAKEKIGINSLLLQTLLPLLLISYCHIAGHREHEIFYFKYSVYIFHHLKNLDKNNILQNMCDPMI